jgi:hypothetical protein
MPTEEWFKENPKVSVYLSPNLHQLLTAWMEKNGIRKNTQALTTILEEYFGVNQSKPVKSNLDSSRIELLEGKVDSLSRELEDLTQAFQQFSSRPKVDQVENSGQLSIPDIEDKREKIEISPRVEQSKPSTETQETVELKPIMYTKELAVFLEWSEDKLTSRWKRGNAVEEKGYRFIAEKPEKKVIWKHERLTEPTLLPETFVE